MVGYNAHFCFNQSVISIVMMPPQALLNAKRLKQLALLAFFLTFIYLFTYSGRIESGDTRTLFNATSSFVQYGDFLLDKTAWYNQPESIANPSNYFLGDYDAEPLQIVMAAPLYWLAEHVPGIGLVHTVWLLNTLVCTLVCAVMYLYALALGYSEKIAIFVSLALGLTSIFWPYSKSFFREPLAALLIFLGALALERCRRARYRDWKWLVIAVVSLVGAMLTKDAIVLALPALVMLVLPSIGGPLCRNLHRVMTAMLVLSVVGLIFLFVLTQFLPPDFLGPLYPTLSRLVHQPVNYMPTAMHTYLLSIGGSVWADRKSVV